MSRRTRAGQDVARLHSGDLSVWSAVAEQIRRLERHGIPYTLTPGVPAFAAAAAALGRELTIPEVAQSLVLTRVSGRASTMPAGETLAGFGATGATLAIHLAIHALAARRRGADAALRRRLPGRDRGPRARWPDERIVRGTLATIEARLAADPIERTALIFVGPRAGGGGLPRERALRRRLPAAVPRAGRIVSGEPAGGTPRRAALAPAELQAAQLREPGHVWLAGAGPGDPGCLTLDVVSALARPMRSSTTRWFDPRSLRAARDRRELHFVGKRGGQPSTPQDEITALLVRLAREGRGCCG